MASYLRICSSGFFLLAFAWCSASLAQDEEDLEVELFFAPAETVTSAARHEQDIGMSPSAITVISREDIEASGATTIPDLLRLVPGMDVIVASSFFTAVNSRLYWNYENVMYLVLVDGREANVELLGQPPFEIQPIDIEDIEKIEVIRGPGSSLYGANAVAGVISITTRPTGDQPEGRIRLRFGEVGHTSASARASIRIGDLGLALSGGLDRQGTFTDPRRSGKDVWKFRALVDYRLGGTDGLLLDLGLSEGSGSLGSPMGLLDTTMGLRTLRLAIDWKWLEGQLYWSQVPFDASLEAPLEYGGILLATFKPVQGTAQTLVGEVQAELPSFWNPLLIILGCDGRFSWLESGDLLDADTFTDRNSARYHQPGFEHRELRAGAFLHTELTPANWVTLTASLRFDYNTETEEFLSPRFAAVFRPFSDHFLRIGVARAFRKPAIHETRLHMMADFPETSPITGSARTSFQEFLTRVMGEDNLVNEELLSFEAGYLGRFLDGRLSVSLDLYYNMMRNLVVLNPQIIEDERGLPNLDESSFLSANIGPDFDIFGGEIAVRYRPIPEVSLVAAWAHREVIDRKVDPDLTSNESPKNLLTLGGRFRTGFGMVGSLYAFSRSEFWHPAVENPGGLLAPSLKSKMENMVLIMGRLGWRLPCFSWMELEAGLKLFLPVSLSSPHFRYREAGGGTGPDGKPYGGDLLSRMLTIYFSGSF